LEGVGRLNIYFVKKKGEMRGGLILDLF